MTAQALIDAVLVGETPDHMLLDSLAEPEWEETIERLLESQIGRRWLRDAPQLGHVWPREKVHHRLLEHEEDFRSTRRDVTLNMLLDCVGDEDLLRHACAIAAGPAGTFFWERWGDDPDEMTRIASHIVTTCDSVAAESTLYRLIIGPIDSWSLGVERRQQIAVAALNSASADVRGLAAEYLATDAPAELLADFDALVHDESERVRGIVWSAALRLARADARDLAFTIIVDESPPLEIRRSALIAVGTILPTSDLIELLSFLVLHPNIDLAADAASLLYNQHRQPDIALAAQRSPHPHIREIAETLLDPLHGSPAAGGSRPGVQGQFNTADIYRDVIRQFEERTEKTDVRL